LDVLARGRQAIVFGLGNGRVLRRYTVDGPSAEYEARLMRYREGEGYPVPRRLAEVLTQVYEIAQRHDTQVMNVFHAGDGNLHPLLLFDGSDLEAVERVHAAGGEIVRASLDAGGVLSGEHGIGVEKRDYMPELFTDDDLDHQERARRAFDPTCRINPGKVLPTGHSCADIQALSRVPAGVWG
jgi:glycolate oxidase